MTLPQGLHFTTVQTYPLSMPRLRLTDGHGRGRCKRMYVPAAFTSSPEHRDAVALSMCCCDWLREALLSVFNSTISLFLYAHAVSRRFVSRARPVRAAAASSRHVHLAEFITCVSRPCISIRRDQNDWYGVAARTAVDADRRTPGQEYNSADKYNQDGAR